MHGSPVLQLVCCCRSELGGGAYRLVPHPETLDASYPPPGTLDASYPPPPPTHPSRLAGLARLRFRVHQITYVPALILLELLWCGDVAFSFTTFQVLVTPMFGGVRAV